ncbi:MAG: dialkylresorcinol condensing enzyme DarA, partial [Chitinophagaceae bacterium]
MKKVLVIYYSQSGQLESIARAVAGPMVKSEDIDVTFYQIEMENPFPFPWDKKSFFSVFPESFLQVPSTLKPVPDSILNTRFDLVLLHYQVWYLSPSIPINSFLQSGEAKAILNHTPVVTISGSRNMWIMAQEKIKKLLSDNSAALKGNIALIDRAGNLISVVTIVKWMFSGEKKRYLGIFPLPGVSDKDIRDSERFGKIIASHLREDMLDGLQEELLAHDSVKINSYLVTVDRTANKIFSKWSKLISSQQEHRSLLLKVFNVYLWVAIWFISPIVYLLHVSSYPFRISKLKQESDYYR